MGLLAAARPKWGTNVSSTVVATCSPARSRHQTRPEFNRGLAAEACSSCRAVAVTGCSDRSRSRGQSRHRVCLRSSRRHFPAQTPAAFASHATPTLNLMNSVGVLGANARLPSAPHPCAFCCFEVSQHVQGQCATGSSDVSLPQSAALSACAPVKRAGWPPEPRGTPQLLTQDYLGAPVPPAGAFLHLKPPVRSMTACMN